MRTVLRCAATALALLPAAAAAAECPWLNEAEAALVIATQPSEARVEKTPVFPNRQELLSSTRCSFSVARELVGHLSVTAMYFGSYEAATAAYQRELAASAAYASPSMIGATPAFVLEVPGTSMTSYAVKERYFLIVAHVFGRHAKEAMASGKAGAILSTHEVARRVLAKL